MGPVLGTPELFQLLHIVTPRLSMVQTTSLLNTNMVICPPAFLSSYPELCNAVSRSQVTIHQYHFLPPMVTLRWFRFWSNLSPPAICTDCIVLLELGTGEGGLLLTLSWGMVLVYWLFLSTRMSTSFWEEKKVCRQNVIGKQDERKVIFVCKKLIPIGTVTIFNHQSYTR